MTVLALGFAAIITIGTISAWVYDRWFAGNGGPQ